MHRDNSDRYQVQLAPSLAGHKRLGSYLVDAGLINRGQVEVALNDQKVTGMKFGEILVTRGWIKQQTVEFIMEKVVLPERQQPDDDPTPVHHLSHRKHDHNNGGQQFPDNAQPNDSAAISTDDQRFRTMSTAKSKLTSELHQNASQKSGQRRVPPITKPLPSVPANKDGINWVG